jgi:acyl-CoA dehydrogenase
LASLTIPAVTLPPECEALRLEVRRFLKKESKSWTTHSRAASWMGYDAEFSRKLGKRGWIGMTWPKAVGGHERSFLERYVVQEELLAAGAPVGAHWTADRQSGPLLIRFGNDRMRKTIVPKIAKGEVFFCIGLSEPDSGSDLASVRTRAERTDEGWRINGRKIWTSKGHKCHYMIALFRTGRDENDRHAGLSQFLVDLKNTPGIEIRPIYDLTGEHHFNEVLFDNALLPADSMIGAEGAGWNQAGTELAYERSGPERYLTSIELLLQMIAAASPRNERQVVALGRLVAEARTLRQMSLGVAGMLSRGEDPGVNAALVKELGTSFEQRIPQLAGELFDIEAGDTSTDLGQALETVMLRAPAFSLRGGTREILKGIIARGLGLR